MAGGTDLLERVRSALAGAPGMTERRMFGSMGFLVRGHLCVSCRPQRIMCRIDPGLHDAAILESGCSTVVMKGHECRGYVYVDADSLRTARMLRRWIDLALSHNQTLTPKSG
jgi:TfoX/Sxy family transcriptional regulator of competence genes